LPNIISRQQVYAMILGYARVSKADDQDTTTPGRSSQGRRMRAHVRGKNLGRSLGPARTSSAARQRAHWRRSGGLETRSAVTLTQGSGSHSGTARQDWRSVPLVDRSRRYGRTGRTNDDANAWFLLPNSSELWSRNVLRPASGTPVLMAVSAGVNQSSHPIRKIEVRAMLDAGRSGGRHCQDIPCPPRYHQPRPSLRTGLAILFHRARFPNRSIWWPKIAAMMSPGP